MLGYDCRLPFSFSFGFPSRPTIPCSRSFFACLTTRPALSRLPPVFSCGRHTSPFSTRRHSALPSSRTTLLDSCPALRPRWCPKHSPYRIQDYCLPAQGSCRLYLLKIRRISSRSTTIYISELNTEPAPSIPSGFGLPLPGLPSDFSAGLMVNLWPDGNWIIRPSPIG